MPIAPPFRHLLREFHRGGVNIDAAPQEAIALVSDAYAPPDDHAALHPRGPRRKWR